jgi:RNA polymerase sigma-54 factor
MGIELKQGMRLSQSLVVTPQLQQAIKLLQLSRMELTTLIQRELMENPVLEEEDEDEDVTKEIKASAGETHEQAKIEDKGHDHSADEVGSKDGQMKEPTDFDWENYLDKYNSTEERALPRISETPEDLPTYENTLTKPESMQEHLLWQLHLSNFTAGEVDIGEEIIGNINEDGYLQSTTDEISAKTGHTLEIVEKVLRKMQDFDPVGIAARDIKECLIKQAMHLGEDAPLIKRVIEENLPDMERHNYQLIAKKQGVSLDKVKEIAHVISNMEPKPGRAYNQENPQYITPDVYVHKLGEEYIVVLNEDGLPKLQISNFYRRMLGRQESVAPQAKEYIQNKLKAAMWLIKSIHQRQRTLYRVTKSIVKHQKDFLEKGTSYLKPMVLKDVAEDIGMHESTISRVTTNKFVHTPKGIFELKYFFNSKIDGVSGEDNVASEAVKNRIQKLIDAEDLKKPLSDQDIADVLKDQNKINVARRTVAKYREMLKIPTSSRRRRRD